MSRMALESIEDVVIESDGVFKYVLVELKDKNGQTKYIVRGFDWAEYHGKNRVPIHLSIFLYPS